MSDDELLAEQRRFYRARAPEYDEWWQRREHYDPGPELAAEWNRQIDQVEAALDEFAVSGGVVDLAGGTGWWTERLARRADRLMIVDSSPETLGLNRRRVGRAGVEYVVADLFDWTPPRDWAAQLEATRWFIFGSAHPAGNGGR